MVKRKQTRRTHTPVAEQFPATRFKQFQASASVLHAGCLGFSTLPATSLLVVGELPRLKPTSGLSGRPAKAVSLALGLSTFANGFLSALDVRLDCVLAPAYAAITGVAQS